MEERKTSSQSLGRLRLTQRVESKKSTGTSKKIIKNNLLTFRNGWGERGIRKSDGELVDIFRMKRKGSQPN